MVPQRMEVLWAFRQKGHVAVLRVKVLLQSERSRVPMKCAPEELKQSAILKRDMER